MTDSDALRSVYPPIAGVNSLGAVLIAVGATVLGVAIEAAVGHRELGTVFAVFYVLGCVSAVLAVRQSAIFTAVIQPPLLLFVTVPLTYYLFHSDDLGGLKGFLITCCYPLIERFPLMLFAAATVLAIGVARRYLPAPAADEPAQHTLFGGLAARLFPQPREKTERDARRESNRAAERAAGRDSERRPRHAARPHQGPGERDRPQRPRRDPAPQQRRRRSPDEAPQRPAQEPRRTPRERRDPRDPRESYPPRPSRSAGYEPRRGYDRRAESPDPRGEYPPRRRRKSPEDYRRYEPYPAPRPRRDGGDHHPVSRVRYRGSDPDSPPRRDY